MKRVSFVGAVLGGAIGFFFAVYFLDLSEDFFINEAVIFFICIAVPMFLGVLLGRKVEQNFFPKWLVTLFNAVAAFVETVLFVLFAAFFVSLILFSSGFLSENNFYSVAAGLIFIFTVGFIYFVWKLENKSKLIVGAAAMGALFGFLLVLTSFSYPGNKTHAKDARRISNIRQIQLGLELYADEHDNTYPAIGEGCQDITALLEFLVPKYLDFLPRDPEVELKKHTQYQISIQPNKQNYILKAVFDLDANRALIDDVDGKVLGCNCDDPSYCVRL